MEDTRPKCPSSAVFHGRILATNDLELGGLLGTNGNGLRNGGNIENGDPRDGRDGKMPLPGPKILL